MSDVHNKLLVLKLKKLQEHANGSLKHLSLSFFVKWGFAYIYEDSVFNEIDLARERGDALEVERLSFYVLDSNLDFVKNRDGFTFEFTEQEKILYGV